MPGGRPVIGSAPRDQKLTIRLTPAELAQIEASAGEANIERSEYARRKLLAPSFCAAGLAQALSDLPSAYCVKSVMLRDDQSVVAVYEHQSTGLFISRAYTTDGVVHHAFGNKINGKMSAREIAEWPLDSDRLLQVTGLAGEVGDASLVLNGCNDDYGFREEIEVTIFADGSEPEIVITWPPQ